MKQFITAVNLHTLEDRNKWRCCLEQRLIRSYVGKTAQHQLGLEITGILNEWIRIDFVFKSYT